MKSFRALGLIFTLALAFSAHGQSWITAYNTGLQEARLGHWHQARDAFKQAAANRPDDVSKPTVLPGSPTEPRKWRNGAPYSPNFLAAYCGYRDVLDVADANEQGNSLKKVAGEFETLLAKNEQSKDAYFFLDLIYTRLGDQTKRQDLDARFQRNGASLNWKVDEEIIAPEEIASMSAVAVPQVVAPVETPPSRPHQAGATPPPGHMLTSTVGGLGVNGVAPVPDKFALIVSEGAATPFASQDAQVIRDALINFGGYSPANVTALANGSSAQIWDAAHQLASRVPQDGVVLVYFVGNGVDLNGKDYLVAADSTGPSDTAHMVSKSDLYDLFLMRGGRVFAFFEVSRPIVGDSYFGSEAPATGAVSQMEATIPDANITSVYYNGQQVGLYAEAFADVLTEMRSNRIPIYEFGWQLFNKMRRGNTGTSSGASHQIPTLPVLNNLAADARF